MGGSPGVRADLPAHVLELCSRAMEGAGVAMFVTGPRSAQQVASSLLVITTAGTVRTPRRLARLTTAGSLIARTCTSQLRQALAHANSTTSLHMPHPALKASTWRLRASARSGRPRPV